MAIKRVKTDRVKRKGGGGVVERKRDSQMWRDKWERVRSRWKLSTNLKECIGKKAAAHVVCVVEGRDGWWVI